MDSHRLIRMYFSDEFTQTTNNLFPLMDLHKQNNKNVLIYFNGSTQIKMNVFIPSNGFVKNNSFIYFFMWIHTE